EVRRFLPDRPNFPVLGFIQVLLSSAMAGGRTPAMASVLMVLMGLAVALVVSFGLFPPRPRPELLMVTRQLGRQVGQWLHQFSKPNRRQLFPTTPAKLLATAQQSAQIALGVEGAAPLPQRAQELALGHYELVHLISMLEGTQELTPEPELSRVFVVAQAL